MPEQFALSNERKLTMSNVRYKVEVTNDGMTITLMPELLNKHLVFPENEPVTVTFSNAQLVNLNPDACPSRGDFMDSRDWTIACLSQWIALANYEVNEDFLLESDLA